MRQIAMALILVIVVSCRTQQKTEVPVKTVTEIHERVVELPAVQDSAFIEMFMYCDSTNQVIMRDYSELMSKYMSVQSSVLDTKSGLKVSIASRTNQPPVTVTVHDTIKSRDVPVYIKGDTIEVERELSWIQTSAIWSGAAAWIILLIFIITRFFNPLKR